MTRPLGKVRGGGTPEIGSEVEGRLLVVNNDPDMCEALTAALRELGYDRVDSTTTAGQCLLLMERNEYDCVFVDAEFEQGQSGLALCERIAESRSDIPVIIVTGHADTRAAIGAIRSGAYDFVTKPVSNDVLEMVVSRAALRRAHADPATRLRLGYTEALPIEEIIGASEPIRSVCDLIHRVSATDVAVLITGESGTGKELVARAIRSQGRRALQPFVAINCAAMSPALLESELFGHTRGAFTDAKRAHPGLFVQASGGTLFLDEIGEMPQDLQAKLLRVLQEQRVRPVGGEEMIAVDTRIIAATNRDLDAEVEAGRFRDDLFYRLDVVRIDVPPLRERGADILSLAHYFLARSKSAKDRGVCGIASAAERALRSYTWPGNVRELGNAMEQAVALTQSPEIQLGDLPAVVRHYRSKRIDVNDRDVESLPTLEEFARRYIYRVLEAIDGNKTQAARVLGVNRRTLYRKLQRLDPTGTDG